ncbi:unnamed protein product [Linum trigynum]|uniref:Uncharacterized protein n=1 Tax=Linum trigynum TaxID=586398 RepID=A0AAV2CQ60_9ROSI
MKVAIKEKTMVRPAEDTPRQQLWLSNLDLLQLKAHVRTVYAYTNSTTDSSEFFFDAKVLKDALSRALVPFYPMAGRLIGPEKGKGSGRLELECNGEGALFLEAETESSIDELGEFVPSPEVELGELVPGVDYSQEISSVPMLVLQVTRFKCGGVCLGIGVHHMVADGASALQFINTWSEMARGGGCILRNTAATTVQSFDRTILRARDPPTPKFHHTEYDTHPTMVIPTPLIPSTPIIHMMKITQNQITSLKNKANITLSGNRYSNHDILTAHIWRCATRARGLPDGQPTKLQISVDGRSRLNPTMPPTFFGNVIFHATPIATAGELAAETIADTADRIRRAISRMDDEYLRSAIDYLEDLGSKDGVIRVPGTCRSPNLKLVSWIRLPFRNADFGWGSPILIRKAADYNEGTGHILPPGDDGSLRLVICLEAGVVEAFQKFFYET